MVYMGIYGYIYGYRANDGKRLGCGLVLRNETFQEFFNWIVYRSMRNGRGGKWANDNDGVTANETNDRLIVDESES